MSKVRYSINLDISKSWWDSAWLGIQSHDILAQRKTNSSIGTVSQILWLTEGWKNLQTHSASIWHRIVFLYKRRTKGKIVPNGEAHSGVDEEVNE